MFVWFLSMGRYAIESTHLTALLIDSGHCSPAIGKFREFILNEEAVLGIPMLYWSVLAVVTPFAVYADSKLEVTWGWKEGATQINEGKVFVWSLLPFAIFVAQMTGASLMAITINLSAVEFALAQCISPRIA